ncbi:hypothetical protein LJB42_000094 [Komagataella kurtzmanii]|nr:hypothetical protein LJB42_000094 [Komagataella kurtzmanii]
MIMITSEASRKPRNKVLKYDPFLKEDGRYHCLEFQCSKSFSRPDHLARHQLNHKTKHTYNCAWPGCHKTFVRSDVKDKHYKRHQKREEKFKLKEQNKNKLKRKVSDPQISTLFSLGKQPAVELETELNPPQPLALTALSDVESDLTLPPSELIQYFFKDDRSDSINLTNFEFGLPGDAFSPLSINESFSMLPISENQTLVDYELQAQLIESLPQLSVESDFTLPLIETSLQSYWTFHHPQFPIIHKPSFSTKRAHPYLVLAMIMVGATYDKFTVSICDKIGVPLRWSICSCEEFAPPPKSWVIQSLNLLEIYELTSSNRRLHERAYLNHGLKIQLLRRSALFGGNPLKTEQDGDRHGTWEKWIEDESLKRAALMAFYLDTQHAVIFGHEITLYLHQIKLSLPCDEHLWESSKLDDCKKSCGNEIKFLDALKKLLHRNKITTSRFGKKLLLAGLLTIMFQMEQKDMQVSVLEWVSVKYQWKEVISSAIEFWKFAICQDGCCNNQDQLIYQVNYPQDTACKFPLYHLAESYMQLTHYDYLIYAGAPSRMNVKACGRDYEAVERRIQRWSKTFNARLAVVHGYAFLCELLLMPQDSPEYSEQIIDYNASADHHLYRPHVVTSIAFVLWAYTFCTEGPESYLLRSPIMENGDSLPAREEGYTYLKRIGTELSLKLGGVFHGVTFHSSMKLYANVIDEISSKNHIVGLLRLLKSKIETHRSEILREHCKLLNNCIERSLGKRAVTCQNMYG